MLGPLRASLKKLRLLFDTGRGLAASTCQSNKPSSLNGSGGGVANANVPPLHACGTARQECGEYQKSRCNTELNPFEMQLGGQSCFPWLCTKSYNRVDVPRPTPFWGSVIFPSCCENKHFPCLTWYKIRPFLKTILPLKPLCSLLPLACYLESGFCTNQV